jgi:RNA polymerase sigma factor (sigma-70 family)
MEPDWLVEVFEEHRPQLRAVAYRMLGSVSEADDALQDAWLRVSRADTTGVENLGGWLTTVVARVCLNMLRSRERRREQPLEVHVPEPILGPAGGMDPEQETLLADAVGLALMVVLDTLTPAERLAFVLHDMFAVPFEQIAPMVERSPAATRQLASRARRRVRGQAPAPDPDLVGQRAVVEAFFAAARSGDFEALVAVLDPDVVLRADGGAAQTRPSMIIRGARAVASQAVLAQRLARFVRPVLINGTAGAVTVVHGRVFSVMAFTIRGGQVAAIDVLYDPQRLVDLDLADLDDARPGATPGPATGSGTAASLLTEANSASADSTWVLVREPSASADARDPAPRGPAAGPRLGIKDSRSKEAD